MIQNFVDCFMDARETIKTDLRTNPPRGYDDLVKRLIVVLANVHDDHGSPDPERIHIIDDGDYQGTQLYIIAAQGYQPSTYWAIFVDYGSCSGCDTFESISSLSYGDTLTDEQVDEYWTLMLHMVQSMKAIG